MSSALMLDKVRLQLEVSKGLKKDLKQAGTADLSAQ